MSDENSGASTEGSPASDSTSNSGAPAAASPTAGSNDGAGEAPKSLKDAIEASLNKGSTNAGESPNPNTGQNSAANAEDPNKPLPFHEHPRWKEMQTERDQAIQASRVASEYHKPFEEHGVSEEDRVAIREMGIDVFKAINGEADAEAILGKMEPIMTALLAAAGRALPQDLQERVTAGTLSPEDAKEMAKLRLSNTHATNREKRAQEMTQQQQQEWRKEQNRIFSEGLRTAVATWESQEKQLDPDYGRKQNFIISEVRLRLAQQQPKSNDEAVRIAKEAKAAVDKMFAEAMPQRPSIRPINGGGAPASGVSTAPTSLRDAVNRSVGR